MQQLPDAATKEALRYRTALFNGFKSLVDKPLCTSTAVSVCSAIKGSDMKIRKVPGTALANDKSGKVIYTPPVGEDVILEKLSNWEKFLHYSTDIDPLVRMAVGHYQFEAIHPFSDGNGRTGRIMNLLFLIQEGLLHQPILYLSRFILANKSDYYSLLLKVTKEGAWENWILYMLDGVIETSKWTRQKVAAIKSLTEHTADYIEGMLPKIYSRELIDILFFQPYCRISNLVESGIAKRETSSSYLKKLCKVGVLEEVKAGRDKVFVHPKFLKLLTSDDHEFTEYKT
jgi:Fic family protein